MLLVAVVLSLLIGISLGILGGGGSILTVPILVYVLGVEAHAAVATSLLVVGVTAAAGSIGHARAGRVRWKTALVFGSASMVGAFITGKVAHLLSPQLLLGAFAIMMVATAVAMLRGRSARASRDPSRGDLPVAKVLAEGLVVGGITGLVGAGGGFLVVPALVLLGRLPMEVAVGTSLVVIAMKSFAAFAGHVSHAHVDWQLASLVTVAAVLGSVVGGRLVGRIPPDRLRRAFAWFVLAMGAFMITQQLVPVASWQWLAHQARLASGLVRPLLGGVLIGLAASLLLLSHGKVAGISGVYGGLLRKKVQDQAFRIWFLGGLVLAGLVARFVAPETFGAPVTANLWIVALAGLLVGWGTRRANGCTSGHGVCGLSRFSVRSLVAVVTFISAGIVTTLLTRG